MKDWKFIALLLCGYGLFKELRPSEFFLTEYLIQDKGFDKEMVIHVAFPLLTYTFFATLPFIFLFTDILRYRPIIFTEAAAFVVAYALLIWGDEHSSLKATQIFLGVAASSEIAYLTYIYAHVGKQYYKRVTAFTHSAVFIGNLVSAIIAQLFVSFHILDLHDLNYLSLGGVVVAMFIAFSLPTARVSIYFNRKHSLAAAAALEQIRQMKLGNLEMVNGELKIKKRTFPQRVKRAIEVLVEHFKETYSNVYILKWSLWWAIAMAGHLQVVEYYEALWEEIAKPTQETHHVVYNGAVNAVQAALSIFFALLVSRFQIPWFKWGETVLCFISLVQGITLIWMSFTNYLFVAYGTYITYRTLYQVLITVASAEVAERISEDSHGFIFGLNTFVALCIQSVLTLVVNDRVGLALDIRYEFLVYGGYYTVLGLAFSFVAMYNFCKHGCIDVNWNVPTSESEVYSVEGSVKQVALI